MRAPMRTRTLEHVTLTTGDRRTSPRHEVGDAAITLLAPLLARVLAGETVDLPGVPDGYRLRGVGDGRGAALTVVGPSGLLVVTIAVAGDSSGAAALWRQVHEYALAGTPLGTRADAPPAPPWCAVRVEPGALRHPDALEWLGDLERCLAWALIERGSAEDGSEGVQ